MAKTKQTARKTNTPGMSTCQDDSTSSSSSGEEVDTNAGVQAERRQAEIQPAHLHQRRREGHPSSQRGANKVQVFLEYSSDEVSE